MKRLPVMESFYTLQGEGMFNGVAAYFIRLAGCDVGCSWCDVKESWTAASHPLISVDKLVKEAVLSGTEIVVITGGEPLMYNLDELTLKIQHAGLKTHLETSGAYKLSGSWDWICVSPKKFKEALPDCLARADELKVIVVNKHDFKWGQKQAKFVSSTCIKLIQPEWSKADQVLPKMIDFVKANPQWRISLQEHKYINIP